MQLISLLLVSLVQGAFHKNINKATVYFSERTKDVETSKRIVFRQGFQWAGGDDFNAHYQSTEPPSLDKVCDSPSFLTGEFGRCLLVFGRKYRFGDPVIVNSPEPCLTSTCVATVNKTIARNAVMYSVKDVGPHLDIEMTFNFIPGNLHLSSSARSNAGVSIPFKGPGVATISFKPMCYLLNGTLTFSSDNWANGFKVENSVIICIPLTLADGSLDGIYKIKVSNLA
ncbi:hypothetical protein DSO57_1014930 [Entomophthora muscae]|uniref:Uncharacterized protein n=1 Tax=Entomophthora muscae TaxID=34485 RepID=A0ACC2U3B6_9FUNG|nr:hypothetical protein DSO57_1014930 [Entomophthora muscae]